MTKQNKTAITPTRDEDFPEWFQQVVKAADLAESSAVRGCYVIKPNGYSIWEIIQKELDARIKKAGVRNAYFPLLIPLSYIAKEADHIDGFAKECAVVTHHRLEADGKGGLQPAGELTEPYVIRPTSETIIGESMSKWVNSYRDLPLKLNQWANVMRWEMRPRVFLRTAEFLWQEGHNAFATAEEANEDALKMLDVYADVLENVLAIPGIKGEKTADERFPGAIATYTFEAMMQDGKSLQSCTSHDLGQTFSKGFDIKYQDKEGSEKHAWTTSWGLSTRTIGALIMVHSDDDGLKLPPRAAETQVVVIPFIKDDADRAKLEEYCDSVVVQLEAQGVRAALDASDGRAGDKIWTHIKCGTPVRVEIGMREMEEGSLTYTRRDIGRDSKQSVPVDNFVDNCVNILDEMHNYMYEQAKNLLDQNIVDISSCDELEKFFNDKRNKGFARMDISILDDKALEQVKKNHALKSCCIPFADQGKKVIIGRSY
jgi:prolyl-tRNA synthetase